MELISVTNKKTQLHKSPADLSVICSHDHSSKQTVSSDVSFFQSSVSQKCFAQIYKGDILELWRIKTGKDGKETFDRLRKIKADGVQAVCCGTNREAAPEYALGFASGQIKIRELDSKNTEKISFPADPSMKASVVSLDYSNCGGYLSSVYENGMINIFGLKTKIKSDTIVLDRNSYWARFHPAKRFHLAVASFKGCVTIFDIAAKKIHFQDKEAHDAPCRDIAMPEDIPDRLLTCGCDSIIKIYDTRLKPTGIQIQSYCGLSTICVTKCGGIFAAGNLKGDVLTYDMRNLRQPLATMKVGNELVTRINFLPPGEGSVDQLPIMSHRLSTASTDGLPEPRESADEYTMEDVLGYQRRRVSDIDFSVKSTVSTFSAAGDRRSDNFGRNIANALNDLSFSSDLSFTERNMDVIEADIENFVRNLGPRETFSKRRSSHMPTTPLQLIEEESGKENRITALRRRAFTPSAAILSPRFASTPATAIRIFTAKEPSPDDDDVAAEIIDVDAMNTPPRRVTTDERKESQLSVNSSGAMHESQVLDPSTSQIAFDFKKEFEALHEKIHFEVQSLSMDLSGRHFETMYHITGQKRQLQDRIKMIEECMGVLMNDDFKINRIMELENENRQLRREFDDLSRGLNG